MEHEPKAGTLAVWAGEQGPFWEQATQVPVVHSVSFGYADTAAKINTVHMDREPIEKISSFTS